MQNAKITTIYSISLVIATLSGMIMYSGNLETMNKEYNPVYQVEAKTTTSTGVLEATKDWTGNLSKTIQAIWNVKTPVIVQKSISVTTAKPSITSLIEVKKEKIFESKIIYRNGWNDPRVQYAYDLSKGNMDFILTIEAESRWDVNALWDNWNSFWLCQIHKRWNKALQLQYRSLKTDNEKINLCYDQYMWWVKRWVIKTRLYWYNYRKARAYLFTFK